MPLWQIFHPPDLFTDEEKATFAETITKQVYNRLPAFFVDVIFQPVPASSLFVGGKSTSSFVRISIDHIAVHVTGLDDGGERARAVVELIERVVKGALGGKGVRYEWAIRESPRELWMIDGERPPPQWSVAYERWLREDKVSAWTEEEARPAKDARK